MNIKQKGVALVQVLLISAVLSLLAIQFSFTSRDQIQIAQGMNERVEAELRAYTLLNEMIFSALASEYRELSKVPQSLSFLLGRQDEYFTLVVGEEEMVSYRDITGMLSIRYPEHPMFSPLLKKLGYDDQSILEIKEYLRDSQDKDLLSDNGVEPTENIHGALYPNRPFQTKTEAFLYLSPWPLLQEQLGKNIHHYANYELNLTAASKELVAAYYGESLSEKLEQIQDDPVERENVMTALMSKEFSREVITTFPSPYKTMAVEIERSEVLWRETIDVRLSGLSSPPFYIIGRDNN